MNAFFRFKSLRTRLTFWFLLVTMLCLLAVVTTLYFQRAAIIRNREFERLQVVRDLKVGKINTWLEERMSDLQVAAGDEEIRGLERILSKTKEDWTAEDRKVASVSGALMQRYLGSYTAYHEVFFIEATSGRAVIGTNQSREGLDKSKDLYFKEPMRTRKPFIKDIYDSKTEGRPAMAFSAPIFCLEHDGEHLIGVLVMRVDLEHDLYPLIQDRIGGGETGETLLVNKEGFAVNALRWHESAPLKLKIKSELAMRAVGGETGIVESKDYRGERALAAYTYIPQMGWGLVVKRDLAEIYAPIDEMLREMVVLVLISLLVVLIIATFLSGTIVRPVADMGVIVRRFTEGDLDARCQATGADEVASLGTLFNRMAATLADQITIQQRTSEVAETMVAAENLEKFASGLLDKFIDLSGSHLGAFYLRSEDGQRLEHFTSVGLSDGAAQSFSAQDREGELGQVLATGKTFCLRDISPDTAFTFKMTGGTAVPREIMTIPIIVDKRVMAVVLLATLSAYSDTHRTIIDRAQIGMNTALANLMSSRKAVALARELARKNSELEAQTIELEAFSYSVSHDLRAPLRAIDGFSQALIEDCSETIGEEGKNHLDRVRAATQRMGRLIDDLLKLSRLSRAEMLYETVDLSAMAEETAEELRNGDSKRAVKFTITPGLTDHGDASLLRAALGNLLENAWKFSAKSDGARIEFGVELKDGDSVYFIRDNGAGFDMAYADKLFGAFQRLHGASEFPGEGIGLATVQRIIRRHGGRVWATGEVGKGASFYFTLKTDGNRS